MIKSGYAPQNESITLVVIDEDKLEKAMKRHNYDADSYFEFLQDVYGLEDGEDFQAGNTGLDLMIRSSVPKKKIDKLKKELCESTSMNEGIRFSDYKIQKKIYDKYKEIAKVPPKYTYRAYTADTYKNWYEYMLKQGDINADFLNESASMHESTLDGDVINWNKIRVGSIVSWSIEGMRLPKVGDTFRIGPFVGICIKIADSKVYMKVESNSRELNESLSESSPDYKELIKLGCDMERAKPDGTNSFFDVRLDHSLLKKYKYKYIETNSSDHTAAHYTNGKYVVTSVASSTGYVSICKLGSNAKKIIDSGEEFDIFNDSFDK